MKNKEPVLTPEVELTSEEVNAKLIRVTEAVREALPAVETISYAISVGNKQIQLNNVPLASNTTYFQAQIISIYGGLGAGKYTFAGTDITVEITEE